MATITQIKQQHVLAAGTVGRRGGGEDCSLFLTSHSSRHKFYFHSPIYTCQSRHKSILPAPSFPAQQVKCLLFTLYLILCTSGIFSSVLNLKKILNPVSSPVFFLEVVTVVNVKFASYSQEKKNPT